MVNIDVFDVAPKVDGAHIYADVARIETDQQGLSVTESFFIRNESKPPRTQFGAHSLLTSICPRMPCWRARLRPVPAAWPFRLARASRGQGSLRVSLPVAPRRDPLSDRLSPSVQRKRDAARPCYHGCRQRRCDAPKSMNFERKKSFRRWAGCNGEPGMKTWLATNVPPEKPVEFTVSGTGSMPREQQRIPAGAARVARAWACPPTRVPAPRISQERRPAVAGGGVAGSVPLARPTRWTSTSGNPERLGLALVIAAAFMLRAKPDRPRFWWPLNLRRSRRPCLRASRRPRFARKRSLRLLQTGQLRNRERPQGPWRL